MAQAGRPNSHAARPLKDKFEILSGVESSAEGLRHRAANTRSSTCRYNGRRSPNARGAVALRQPAATTKGEKLRRPSDDRMVRESAPIAALKRSEAY